MRTFLAALTSGFLAAVTACSALSDEEGTPGFLVVAHEAHVFRPCGEGDYLWIDAGPTLFTSLRNRYERLMRAPYDSTFAILVGARGPVLDCAFCEEFPGSFRVDRVVLHREVREGDCG